MSAPARLGFACVWDPEPRSTWSYTPWSLRAALQRKTLVLDVGIQLSPVARRAAQLLALRRRNGRWDAPFQYHARWEQFVERKVRRQVETADCDAVLEIQDLGVVDRPYFTYQDLTADAVLEMYDRDPATTAHFFPHLDRAALLRRRERQHQVYEHATGILAMSEWLARTLVKWSGIPSEKVYVVHPGANAVAAHDAGESPRVRTAPRRRLLFVGTSFMTKGGDIVLGALALLRAQHDPALRLTVAGPARWPLETPVPDGVDFLGRVPVAELASLYDSHDLFVMPSRMEGFGMVFVEALSRGLPCVGRDAYAMPELITPGENGALVSGDDPAELADAIVRVLADDTLYERCARDAIDVARAHTWERAADDVLAAIGNSRSESAA